MRMPATFVVPHRKMENGTGLSKKSVAEVVIVIDVAKLEGERD